MSKFKRMIVSLAVIGMVFSVSDAFAAVAHGTRVSCSLSGKQRIDSAFMDSLFEVYKLEMSCISTSRHPAMAVLRGRRRLPAGAAGLRGLCRGLCGPVRRRAADGRHLPFFPQSHVCGLFCRFYGMRDADPIAGPLRRRPGISNLRPLDHPGGGTMVLGTVRGGLPAVHGAGTALCLAGRISCGLSVSLFNFRNQDVIHHG